MNTEWKHFDCYCLLCLTGYVTTTNLRARDWASQRLFTAFDEERVFAQPTYRGKCC